MTVPEAKRYDDLFLIYHPDDISIVRRIAAQLTALGNSCRFEEDDFRKSALDIAELKANVLRSHSIGVVLSPASAASQLCNELIQFAVNSSKRIVSLILDEDIDVEVHPAIAENPYVFFREQDNLAESVDELRLHLRVDQETLLHTELLVAADSWQRRGRRPSQLLPPERVAEARQWLADSSARTLKPSPLLVEFIHSSRRQRQPSGRNSPWARRGLLLLLAVAILGLIFVILRAALQANQAAQTAAAQTQAAQTDVALTSAAATAASDSAVALVDVLAATSVALAESVRQTEQALAQAATQAVYVTETALAIATDMRATAIYEEALDADAARLAQAAEAALDSGDRELALALAWVAKDHMETPRPAYRVLRQAAAGGRSAMLSNVSLLRIRPGGDKLAIVLSDSGALQILETEQWTSQSVTSDRQEYITQMAYSPDGALLATAASAGEIVIRAGDSGAPLVRIAAHQGAVTALAFHPAGDKLYSAGSEPRLAAWDIDSGEALATYPATGDEAVLVDDLLITADGEQLISWATDGRATVVTQSDADTLEPLDFAGPVYRGYDASGKYGFTGGRSLPAYPDDPNVGDLVIWELATGEQVATLNDGFNWSLGDLTAARDELSFIAFHGALALVGVTSSDGSQRAVLTGLDDGGAIREFDGELAGRLRGAMFLSASMALSATTENRVVLWSLDDGGVIRELGSTRQALSQIDFSAAGDIAAGRADDGSLYLWRLSDTAGAPAETIEDALPGSRISPSGATLALLNEGTVSLRALDTGETLVELAANNVTFAGAAFAVYDGERVTVYPLDGGDEVESWTVDWDSLRELVLSADGALIVAQADDSLWLLRGGREALQLNADDADMPEKVIFAPNGELMLSIHAEYALLWDVESGTALGAFPLERESLAAVDAAFSASGETLYFFALLENGLASLTALSMADNAAIRHSFIDIADGRFSPDAMTLYLSLRKGGVHIVDTATGDIRHRTPMETTLPKGWAALPELDSLIAADGADLVIWDLADGAVDLRFAHTEPLAGFSISDDGQRILTLDAAGIHHLWQVESAADLLRRIASEQSPRELTCAEREHYLVLPLCG